LCARLMQGFGFGGLFDAKEVAAAKEQVAKSLTVKWAATKEAAKAKRQAAKAKVAAAKATKEVAGTGKAVTNVASQAKAVAQSMAWTTLRRGELHVFFEFIRMDSNNGSSVIAFTAA
jgi:hypothetical protein